MGAHAFKIGDIVIYLPQIGTQREGAYEVTRLLPADSPDPSYRLRSLAEQRERVAKEYELRAARGDEAGTDDAGKSETAAPKRWSTRK
jgi:hypothetical protein